jgi:hypothetical protein
MSAVAVALPAAPSDEPRAPAAKRVATAPAAPPPAKKTKTAYLSAAQVRTIIAAQGGKGRAVAAVDAVTEEDRHEVWTEAAQLGGNIPEPYADTDEAVAVLLTRGDSTNAVLAMHYLLKPDELGSLLAFALAYVNVLEDEALQAVCLVSHLASESVVKDVVTRCLECEDFEGGDVLELPWAERALPWVKAAVKAHAAEQGDEEDGEDDEDDEDDEDEDEDGEDEDEDGEDEE